MIPVNLSVRTINKAVAANVTGRGGGVYCDLPDRTRWRIVNACTRRGQLLVLRMHGDWVAPVAIYKEW